MAENSKIEWTDATWNPVTGCSLVSEGCRHCYAATLAATRLKNHPSRAGLARLNAAGEAKFTGEVRFNEGWLDQPLRWKRPRMIFVCAHGDLFHEAVPDEWIDRVFAVMALSPQHTFQVLTKRPERMRAYLAPHDQRRADALGALVIKMGYRDPLELLRWPLPNVWLGVSAEDQAAADARIPVLLDTPAAVRFLSAEPLLGAVDLDAAWHGESALDSECWGDCAWCEKGHPPLHNCSRGRQSSAAWEKGRSGLDWVIAGGESGRNARPMHPDWARSLRDQCAAAGVPFFFKQWGEWAPLPDTSKGETCVWPDGSRDADGNCNLSGGTGQQMARLGKGRAGALLDGREHRAMPGRAL